MPRVWTLRRWTLWGRRLAFNAGYSSSHQVPFHTGQACNLLLIIYYLLTNHFFYLCRQLKSLASPNWANHTTNGSKSSWADQSRTLLVVQECRSAMISFCHMSTPIGWKIDSNSGVLPQLRPFKDHHESHLCNEFPRNHLPSWKQSLWKAKPVRTRLVPRRWSASSDSDRPASLAFLQSVFNHAPINKVTKSIPFNKAYNWLLIQAHD